MFLHVTSYVKGAKYPKLFNKKGGRGFPYLVVMDADGDVTAKMQGARTVENFQKTVDKGKQYQDLKTKKDRTPEEEIKLFNLDWGMGNLTPDQAKARVKAMKGLTDKQRAGLLVPVEIQEHRPQPTARTRQAYAAASVEAGQYYCKMYRAGRRPKSEDSPTFQMFYINILNFAFAKKNVKAFKTALGELKKVYGDNPKAARFFSMQEKRLDQLKADSAKAEPSKKDSSKATAGKKDSDK